MPQNTGERCEDVFKESPSPDLANSHDAVVISDDGIQFKVHKRFLSQESNFFRTFFSNKIDEGNRSINLMFSGKIIEMVLKFIYTGEISFNIENIAELIRVADYLQIESMWRECKNFAVQNILFDSCLSLMSASHFIERLGISDTCFRFVETNFESLVHKRHFDIAQIPFQIFKDLLTSDSLKVTDETTVWKAIVLWVEGDYTARLMHVPAFISCLRWGESNLHLIPLIARHPIFRNNLFCHDIDLGEFIQTSTGKVSVHGHPGSMKYRFPKKLYVFICKKKFPYPTRRTEVFLTYDGQLDIWRKITETMNNFHVVITVGRIVILFNTVTNVMESFDLVRKKRLHSKYESRRRDFFVARHNNCIFVIGGHDYLSNAAICEIEYYMPSTNVWSYYSSLPQLKHCMYFLSGVCVLKDKIYIIGHVDHSSENVAFSYDMSNKVWSSIEKPRQFMTHFAFINFQEKIYILGGRGQHDDTSTDVQVYSPEEKKWNDHPSLLFPYEEPHAVLVEEKLMIYDNCEDELSIPKFPPSTWNEGTQKWEAVDNLSPFIQIHKHRFFCIDDLRTLKELAIENADPETVWTKTPFARN